MPKAVEKSPSIDLYDWPKVPILPKNIDLLSVNGNKKEKNVLVVFQVARSRYCLVFRQWEGNADETEIQLIVQLGNEAALDAPRSEPIYAIGEFFVEADRWLTYFLNYGGYQIAAMRVNSLIWNNALRCESVRTCPNYQVNTNMDIIKLLEMLPQQYARVLVNSSICCSEGEMDGKTNKKTANERDSTKGVQMVHIQELAKLKSPLFKIHVTYITNDAVVALINQWSSGEAFGQLQKLTITVIDKYCVDRLKEVVKKLAKLTPSTQEEAKSKENAVQMKIRHVTTKTFVKCESAVWKVVRNKTAVLPLPATAFIHLYWKAEE